MKKRIIHLFTLSCKKATYLIEKQLHISLTPVEKLQLHTHLLVCKYCVDYKHKAIFLDKLMINEISTCEHNDMFSEQEVVSIKEKFKSAIKQDNNTD